MILLLDLAFIPKARKSVTDQGLDETQTQPGLEEQSTQFISETTGNNSRQCPLYTID